MDEAELNLGATLSPSRDEKEALLLLLSLPSVANVRVPDERDNTKRKPGPPPRYFPITSFPSTAHVPSGRQCLSSGGTINSMDVDVSCALPQKNGSKRWMSQSVSAAVWDDEDGGETDQVPMTSEDDDEEEEEEEEGEGWGEEEEEVAGEKKETYSSPLRSGQVAQRREGTGREDAEGEVLQAVGAGEEEEEEEEEEGREDEEVTFFS
ncbi:hypothetical protein NGA_0649100 [Nannochloropsis gaditana CCMP526]|uniref:uncharacterized protein n=1 Tax=Nannochloropsis gaditana (strain CCMP526) TaxID=1093141 RepID=UPI00029F7BEA|nr:hypothetical protein NGA_0649100 [Nannochloropsis gaditana CCMP526]EKU20687.1 hypothetical protein NGA_0649100 [Nannochloropsis gaditana CCMP526]|eukprot:XP_005855669.1 hypothetical protein NGA_0649100 [Nannochloropsis gaditana CCMP526]